MERIHMADILPLVGLSYPPQGRSSFYVQCPCCDESPNKRHLNINLYKEVFRCPRCGVAGGIFDLYSLFTGVPREKVKNALFSRMALSATNGRQMVQAPPQPVIEEYPITDTDTRHATYSALLSLLSLATDHRDNLRNRGLTDEEIDALGYRTTPAFGGTNIAKQLQTAGCYLQGVPGFYRTETGEWTFVHDRRGILVPVRDPEGRIQGLQIRLDNVEKRKFRWVSSAERKDGCRAECCTHLSGSVTSLLVLTEGPMKADVIHALSGLTVLAVPGVNALSGLKPVLEELRGRGLREIKTAFDMDFCINAHVQTGYQNLYRLLDELDLRYGTYLWDPAYKGLDDYIWEYCLGRQRKNKEIES